MSLYITAECINCGACLPECPNEAIYENRAEAENKGLKVTEKNGTDIYIISVDRCTECIGHFDTPQCAAVCPIPDCCIDDPGVKETREALFNKAKTLWAGTEKEAGLDPNKSWTNPSWASTPA